MRKLALKHRRRKSGQCYSTCPTCVTERDQTDEIVADIFFRWSQQSAFSLGVHIGIASLRWPREQFLETARSLPNPFRDLALATPDWKKPEPWGSGPQGASTV